MLSSGQIKQWLPLTVLMTAFLVFGCAPPSPPQVSQITIQPDNQIPVGETATLSVTARGTDLRFRWTATRGTITGEGSSIIYTAPDTPGPDAVAVEVTSASGAVVQNLTIQVVSPTVVAQEATPTLTATSTPTHAPTATPTSTPMPPTVTSTPTHTHTPTPTPAPTSTPSSTAAPAAAAPAPALPGALLPLSASATVVNAIRVDRTPTIDGSLDEEIWSLAQPLTYAEHPPANDSTTVVVRLLWDDAYLYAGFDVSDAHVEDSAPDNVWDGDSVATIIDNDGEVQEYRYTMLGDVVERQNLIADRAGITSSESKFKGATTLNNPADQDEGYSVEMRIPWATPVAAGDTIAADFWSVDHDQNPGAKYDEEGVVHSTLSWDGDGVDKAGKSILLYDACFDADIVSPAGSNDSNTAAGFPVTNTVTISWEPAECVMIVQSYQNNELKSDYRPVTSGTDINIGDPGSGETEIKIWSEGFMEPSDSIWVWVDASSSSPPEDIITLSPTEFETQDTDGDGIDDQFIFHTDYKRSDLDLPVKDGVDLSDYDLEFTFRGGDGRMAHLWYKSGQDYANVVSFGFTINSDQPIRFNPFVDDREQSDPGFDFAHIWAIGARIPGGIDGVELISARLIKR